MKIRQRVLVGLLCPIAILALFLIGCSSNGSANLPPYVSPEKGNPKLDSQLNQLVLAQAKGEAASFAEKSNIDLTNGHIRVVIECVPGQVEAATKAAINAGAEVETTYENLLQVSVPVTGLTALAAAESVRLIRLPQQPVPLKGNESKSP
jgi:hypothetical protein